MKGVHCKDLKLLAIGDSYTVGTGISQADSFPYQLKRMIEADGLYEVAVDLIAKHGWTSSDLLKAMEDYRRLDNYDIVTVLIGVNNQYDGVAFDIFVSDFNIIIDKAIVAVEGRADRVIVLTIPDYAYTPVGVLMEDPHIISSAIDAYNDFVHSVSLSRDLTYINITDLSRQGLQTPELIAKDGLHLSEAAYRRIAQELVSQLLLLD